MESHFGVNAMKIAPVKTPAVMLGMVGRVEVKLKG